VPRTKVKVFTGKRKKAIARAFIRDGDGNVRINGYPVELWGHEIGRMRVIQTLLLAGDYAKKYDIDVYVRGGGFMGQAEAVSIAIARALVGMSKSKRLESIYESFDRRLLAGDPRRTEPKKPLGPGPRRKKQTSYR